MGAFFPFDVQQLCQRLYKGKVPYDFAKRNEYLCNAVRLYRLLGMSDNVSAVESLIEEDLDSLDYIKNAKLRASELLGTDSECAFSDDSQATSSMHPPSLPKQPPDIIPFAGIFCRPQSVKDGTGDKSDLVVQAIYENLVANSLVDKERTNIKDFKMVFGYQRLSNSNPRPIGWMGEVNVLALFIKTMINKGLILNAENKWSIVECNFVLSKNGSHPSVRALRQARQPRKYMVDIVESIFPTLPGLCLHSPSGLNGAAQG